MNTPWADGPTEILAHAFELLRRDSDAGRRLAFIAVDNAVELMIKTYLGLPQRVTHFHIPRKELQEIEDNFPRLLDALEMHAAGRILKVDLSHLEWFHRIRNQLYHQGCGFSIAREKVEIYAELGIQLLGSLFGNTIISERPKELEQVGRFIDLFTRLETGLVSTAQDVSYVGRAGDTPLRAAQFLKGDVMPPEDYKEFDELRQIRNQVVHGAVDYRQLITETVIQRLQHLVSRYTDDELHG